MFKHISDFYSLNIDEGEVSELQQSCKKKSS